MANKVGVLVDLNSKYLMNMVIEGHWIVILVLFAQLDYSVYYSVVINCQHNYLLDLFHVASNHNLESENPLKNSW